MLLFLPHWYLIPFRKHSDTSDVCEINFRNIQLQALVILPSLTKHAVGWILELLPSRLKLIYKAFAPLHSEPSDPVKTEETAGQCSKRQDAADSRSNDAYSGESLVLTQVRVWSSDSLLSSRSEHEQWVGCLKRVSCDWCKTVQKWEPTDCCTRHKSLPNWQS